MPDIPAEVAGAAWAPADKEEVSPLPCWFSPWQGQPRRRRVLNTSAPLASEGVCSFLPPHLLPIGPGEGFFIIYLFI